MLLDPLLLLGVLHVHVLDGERAAVGVAEHLDRVSEGHRALAGQSVDDELAVEVPQGEAVGRRVELGVKVGRLGSQRVEVRDQVSPHPVHVDEALDVDLLLQAVELVVGGVAVGHEAHRLERHVHRREDLVVEAVLPCQRVRRCATGTCPTRRPG